jgi:hypothetical protein
VADQHRADRSVQVGAARHEPAHDRLAVGRRGRREPQARQLFRIAQGRAQQELCALTPLAARGEQRGVGIDGAFERAEVARLHGA